MKIALVGLTGPAGAGKSTLAQHLAQRMDFLEASFADPLKDMLAALFDVDREELETRYLKRDQKEQPVAGIEKSPRYLLQTLGTEWGRQLVHPDLWVMALHRRLAWMENHLEAGQRGVVVSDVRFENEALMIRRAGGMLVHLRRHGLDRMSHISENGVSIHDCDHVIDNNGDIETTQQQLERLVTQFLTRRAVQSQVA